VNRARSRPARAFPAEIRKGFYRANHRARCGLHAIKTGEQQRGEGKVWICRRVRRAELDSYCFRVGGVSGNANRRGAIARGIGEVNRRFKSRNEALVTVRGRVGDTGERGACFKIPPMKKATVAPTSAVAFRRSSATQVERSKAGIGSLDYLLRDPRSLAISANWARAAWRSSVMSAAMISGPGRLALSSRASAFSQKMSRLILSRLISSS
jgi:hypothetical protein